MRFKMSLFSLALTGLFLISCSHVSSPNGNGTNGGNDTLPAIDTKGDETHDHTYSEEWHHNEHFHYHECDCGAKTDVSAHEWDKGLLTKQATETEDGNITYTCSVCGATKNEKVPKTGSITNGGEYEDNEEWGESHK